MFSFFSKKNTYENAFNFLKTDMHSHLVPGVDDGCASLSDSILLIKGLVELGFEKIITTPHIYQGFYENDKSTLEKPFQEVLGEIGMSIPMIEFSYASEYFADEFFEKKIEHEELLSFSDNYVLLEISFVAYSQRIEHIIFDLMTKGYKPILAHPERYLYLKNSMEIFRKLRQLGCELQINTNSFAGYYGSASQELANKLMDEKLVSYLGTDMHHERHLNCMREIGNNKKLMKKLRAYEWKNSLL
ncbi:tyrosine-protein phosphatase [Arcticibacterium luteifluviistationis]|uniref:protein-tyrosine-phosphatase n=1 Tax=Arcticibacterium luteifluviistationis TaxID=1784714 RepID=A0A2Z4G9W9_9BACT|nr:CpsB/CapC family capsule biosynthesis tyrosine phosphatase [Arcticibacterium luteifluviistationis]AWV98032.1 histidinol phosphatase [Arcticibacterium luteifluviistationis]